MLVNDLTESNQVEMNQKFLIVDPIHRSRLEATRLSQSCVFGIAKQMQASQEHKQVDLSETNGKAL